MMLKEPLIAALSVTAALGFVQPSMANTSPINLDSVFEQSSSPLQIAVLSKQEMQETKGAVAPAVVGAAGGAAAGVAGYAYTSYKNNTPMTWKGAAYAAGAGAVIGSGTSALVGAAGGGIAGNLAWRPGMMALGQGVQMGNPANRPR